MLSTFWAEALGYVIPEPPDGHDSWDDWARAMEIPEENWNDARALIDPDGVGPRVYFQRVPESKVVKNRVHLDLKASEGPGQPLEERRSSVADEAARLVGLGASIVGPVEEQGGYWIVLQDPEGNATSSASTESAGAPSVSPGRLTHHELLTRSANLLRRSHRFRTWSSDGVRTRIEERRRP